MNDRSLVLFVERVEIRIFEHSESSFFVQWPGLEFENFCSAM